MHAAAVRSVSGYGGDRRCLMPGPDGRALFVYGSLLFPDVLRAVLGRVPDRTPATAVGWRAAALRGRLYPGLVPGDTTATGLLITGLTPDEWRVVDAFEDEAYELRRLALADGHVGWTYVWCDEAQVSPHAWDPELFARRDLSAYVQGCLAWRRGYARMPGRHPGPEGADASD
jgi:gamma-glutamylcyclotransferase (GGCT)/AIG2-like uncharacterized protein YtfP